MPLPERSRNVLRRARSAIHARRHCVSDAAASPVSGFGRRREVPVADLLLGAQGGLSGAVFARVSENIMWTSTRVEDGPHATFLRQFEDRDPQSLTVEDVASTAYWRLGLTAIRVFGRYFDAVGPDSLLSHARSFLSERPIGHDAHLLRGATPPGSDITAAWLDGSDCFQLIDGHHRAARAVLRGERSVTVRIHRFGTRTAVQELLLSMSWLQGARELYQPLPMPELGDGWPLVRRCNDRLAKVLAAVDFLEDQGGGRPETHLDVAANYGWFVARLRDAGLRSEGVELDPRSKQLAALAYGLTESELHTASAEDWLAIAGEERRTWDVVTCFSLHHHFVLGRGSVSADELLGRLRGVTSRVLVFDTGQDHEQWFQESLAGWSSTRVAAALRAAGFATVVDLGPDSDSAGRFASNYGRTTFACFTDVLSDSAQAALRERCLGLSEARAVTEAVERGLTSGDRTGL